MRREDPELHVAQTMGVVGVDNHPVVARPGPFCQRSDRPDDLLGGWVPEHPVNEVVEHVHYDQGCAHRCHLLARHALT